MIAITRTNLLRLLSNPNLFLCNSKAHFSPSLHFFSTRRSKTLTPDPQIYDVLVQKHYFSPELASLAASRLPKFRCPQNADSILLFLKANAFTADQIEQIVSYNPRILGFTTEGLRLKFKLFRDLGFSPEEVAKLMTSNKAILHSSMANKIIPSLTVLKSLLGSNQDVARLVRKSPWYVSADLEKTLLPNVEILKSCSIPMERILHLLHFRPRCLLMRPDVMRKSVDKAMGFGVSQSSLTFIDAVNVFAHTSEGIMEVNRKVLLDLGFSSDDMMKFLKQTPLLFSSSMEKTKKVVELLLATGKYSIANIVSNPTTLMCSIEKRLLPRLQILELLESRNLIKKWPGLSRVFALTDDKFIDTFVRPYYDEIAEEYIIKNFFNGKKELEL
ncbi:uncharacterized protein LOC121761870 isoform X1 [Salvia splendens]|uniref:uncharacterized protein LOC121761870 isoform X1 n=1 Tax=Salvia splendens TaxID=180675 RepID=UPI001C2725DC|nr:uncharacterized protein LOC121761870 isoform X1 [Salvia splendens]XP_042013502.1 uncharacterized protein LOC121761870 isoform X1 [Salvia splendens]XP_042013503.1 uncharacterized protein LOC121761870 isoform X1 [Salvia splendens]XP_042013504.1 uncharacterized protein LOC121761870 isoform X1 [Salvia splendens]XP_042013505.1 uncharacterized protein LOC121761870 isoform X1 [Salvia splendens]XP_042013506.1 uncharacterized protein LOC121761870 isoform X1 [Salvia splendens]XP_042013507.1 uncharac